MKNLHFTTFSGLKVLLVVVMSAVCFTMRSYSQSTEGFSTIALRNSDRENLNELKIKGVDEPIIMTKANNLSSRNGKWEFISLGRRKSIEYIQSISEDGYTGSAALFPSNAYIARYPVEFRSIWGVKYCVVAIYCTTMSTDTSHNIIGCKLEYIPDFKPQQKAVTINPFEYGKSVRDQALADWYIVCADANHNGVISDQEKNAVTELSADYPTKAHGLSSLQALDEFPNLRTLSSLTSPSPFVKNLPGLEISHNNLQSITLDELEVGVLDLSGCTNLNHLSLRFSKIGKLILPASLENLFLQHGTFGLLDMSQVPNLKVCVIQDTDLDKIDLSPCKNLEGLRLDAVKLTSLDVSPLTKLNRLSCTGNPMESLDISGNPNISQLDLKSGDCSVKKLIIPTGKTKRNYQGYKTGTFANFSGIEVVNK